MFCLPFTATLIKCKRLSYLLYSSWSLEDMMPNLSLRNTVWNKAVPRKLNTRVCIHCFVPHGSPRNTPTLRTLTSGCSVRTFVSQPVLCCQQWREGVGLIHFYSTSCYSTLNTEPGECLCLRCGRRRGRVIGRRPSQHTKHKCGEQEWKRVSGEELGWAFYHRAIIHLLVNTEEKLSTSTLTALRTVGTTRAGKKRILQLTSAHQLV